MSDEPEKALPEIWTIHRDRSIVRRTIEVVPDRDGLFTAPGSKVPDIDNRLFSALSAYRFADEEWMDEEYGELPYPRR